MVAMQHFSFDPRCAVLLFTEVRLSPCKDRSLTVRTSVKGSLRQSQRVCLEIIKHLATQTPRHARGETLRRNIQIQHNKLPTSTKQRIQPDQLSYPYLTSSVFSVISDNTHWNFISGSQYRPRFRCQLLCIAHLRCRVLWLSNDWWRYTSMGDVLSQNSLIF